MIFQRLSVVQGRYEKIPPCFNKLIITDPKLLRRNMIMKNVLLQLAHQIPSLLCVTSEQDQ
jgi:hypothetical protein